MITPKGMSDLQTDNYFKATIPGQKYFAADSIYIDPMPNAWGIRAFMEFFSDKERAFFAELTTPIVEGEHSYDSRKFRCAYYYLEPGKPHSVEGKEMPRPEMNPVGGTFTIKKHDIGSYTVTFNLKYALGEIVGDFHFNPPTS